MPSACFAEDVAQGNRSGVDRRVIVTIGYERSGFTADSRVQVMDA